MIHRIKMFQSYWHLKNFRSHNDLDLGYTCLGLKSAHLPSLWGTRIQRHTHKSPMKYLINRIPSNTDKFYFSYIDYYRKVLSLQKDKLFISFPKYAFFYVWHHGYLLHLKSYIRVKGIILYTSIFLLVVSDIEGGSSTVGGGKLQRAISCESVASDSSVLEMQPDAPKIGQLEFGLEYDRYFCSFFNIICFPIKSKRPAHDIFPILSMISRLQ